jgi:hypothetical protein
LPAADVPEVLALALGALRLASADGRRRRSRSSVDGAPVGSSAAAEALAAAGFRASYRGWLLRATTPR